MRIYLFTFFLSINLSVLSINFLNAREYYNSQHHFKITLPVDWRELPNELFNAIKQNKNISKNLFAYFCTESNRALFNYPYVMLFYTSLPGIKQRSLESVADMITGTYKTSNSKRNIERLNLNDMIADYSLKETFINKGQGSFFITTESEIANNIIVKMIRGFFLCKDGIVTIFCYSDKENFQLYFSNFKIILDSFRFEKDYEFAHVNKADENSSPSYNLGTYAIGLVFLFSVIVFIFLVIKKRRNHF